MFSKNELKQIKRTDQLLFELKQISNESYKNWGKPETENSRKNEEKERLFEQELETYTFKELELFKKSIKGNHFTEGRKRYITNKLSFFIHALFHGINISSKRTFNICKALRENSFNGMSIREATNYYISSCLILGRGDFHQNKNNNKYYFLD